VNVLSQSIVSYISCSSSNSSVVVVVVVVDVVVVVVAKLLLPQRYFVTVKHVHGLGGVGEAVDCVYTD